MVNLNHFTRRGFNHFLSLISMAVISAAGIASAYNPGDVIITEIMYASNSAQPQWEWVEVKNTTAGAIDLDGWVIDDDDDNGIDGSNISAGISDTVIPAGGVAVLYNAGGLNFDPGRFTNAWGSVSQLIAVSPVTALASPDAVALWQNTDDYDADTLIDEEGPRRSFNSAITGVNFQGESGYPSATGGKSLAWKGSGNVTDPGQWVASLDGDAYGGRLSVETVTNGAQVNSSLDAGSPGVLVGAGALPAGKLTITEIMYNPRSVIGTNEEPFEWVEVYNNRPSTVDFSATPFYLDDNDAPLLASPNVTSGSIAAGGLGVFFNEQVVSLAQMEEIWELNAPGDLEINFIPVTNWSALANGGDLIALWTAANYTTDKTAGASVTTNADSAVNYTNNPTSPTNPWPDDDGNSSIYLSVHGGDPNVGANWGLSALNTHFNPGGIFDDVVDHEGGDQGSPGFVPSSVVVVQPGDFDGNGIVDAADYTVWRDNLGGNSSVLNGNGSGAATVVPADYDLWKANFGEGGPGSGGIAGGAVPEPTSALLLLVALVGLTIGQRSIR